MDSHDDWDVMKKGRGWRPENAGSSLLRVVLLFSSAAVAFAMLIVPMIESRTAGKFAAGYDMTNTGSVGSTNRYTIRRSVLQASRDSICLIRADGTRTGDC